MSRTTGETLQMTSVFVSLGAVSSQHQTQTVNYPHRLSYISFNDSLKNLQTRHVSMNKSNHN